LASALKSTRKVISLTSTISVSYNKRDGVIDESGLPSGAFDRRGTAVAPTRAKSGAMRAGTFISPPKAC
jgi:hypothetical protein